VGFGNGQPATSLQSVVRRVSCGVDRSTLLPLMGLADLPGDRTCGSGSLAFSAPSLAFSVTGWPPRSSRGGDRRTVILSIGPRDLCLPSRDDRPAPGPLGSSSPGIRAAPPPAHRERPLPGDRGRPSVLCDQQKIPFRPRGSSPPRRLAPPTASRVCFASRPVLGFAPFRAPAPRQPQLTSRLAPSPARHTLRSVPLACSRIASPRPLPSCRCPHGSTSGPCSADESVARDRREPAARPLLPWAFVPSKVSPWRSQRGRPKETSERSA